MWVRIPPTARRVNRAGVPGSPAKRCAGNTVGFECSALRWGNAYVDHVKNSRGAVRTGRRCPSRKMNQAGAGLPLEAGWQPRGCGLRVLRLPHDHAVTWRVNRPGMPALPRKQVGVFTLGIVTSALRGVYGCRDTHAALSCAALGALGATAQYAPSHVTLVPRLEGSPA